MPISKIGLCFLVDADRHYTEHQDQTTGLAPSILT
jgi:hypothetical protein